MSDVHRRLADKFLAEGDYVRALEALAKAHRVSDSLSERIQETLERLKRLAAREIATGRWTVAEGIFDVVEEHQRLLTPAQREECHLLLKELQRCRKEELNNGLLQAATKLAAQGLHEEAREICFQAMQVCDDAHLAGRVRRLLLGLPDPAGRLVFGFDSSLEIRQFCRADGGATIAFELPGDHFTRGGYARIFLPGPGAKIVMLDVPDNWSLYSEISFWAQRVKGEGAAFTFGVGDPRSYFFFHAALSESRWTHIRLPLALFEEQGRPQWDQVTQVTIGSADNAPLELNIDELRLVDKAQPLK
ncbi:MAG: hypothetical protein HYY16_09275 [Planctomycetes bacterium]|nr:hypothetical protein [Planctomycetota bacterium]